MFRWSTGQHIEPHGLPSISLAPASPAKHFITCSAHHVMIYTLRTEKIPLYSHQWSQAIPKLRLCSFIVIYRNFPSFNADLNVLCTANTSLGLKPYRNRSHYNNAINPPVLNFTYRNLLCQHISSVTRYHARDLKTSTIWQGLFSSSRGCLVVVLHRLFSSCMK